MPELKSDEYRTIVDSSEGMYKEKGSKFIALAHHVETLEEVNERLDSIRRSYHDARHHCYAYRIGDDGSEFRMNDDGEPSGTAGKPIFNQLLSKELTQIIVVVVRYFGGTKLGTSGLIRAYKSATQDALDQARLVTRIIREPLTLRFPYSVLNDVMRLIKEEDLKIINQDFKTSCLIELMVRKSEVERVEERFSLVYPVETERGTGNT